MARVWQNGFESLDSIFKEERQIGTTDIVYNNCILSYTNSNDEKGTTTNDNYKMYTGYTDGRGGYGKKALFLRTPSYKYTTLARPTRVCFGKSFITADNIKEIYTSFYYKATEIDDTLTTGYSTNLFEITGSAGGYSFMTIKVKTVNGGYQLIHGNLAYPMHYGEWYKIDVHVMTTGHSNKTGLVEIKVNDILVYSEPTDMNEYVAGGYKYTIGNLYYYLGHSSYSIGRAEYCIDDVILNTTSGATNNSWVTQSESILDFYPIANGSKSDFVPLSGSNYENVDDGGVGDGETTYNSTDVLGAIDTFKFGNSDYELDDSAEVTALYAYCEAKVEGTTCGVSLVEQEGSDYVELGTPITTLDYGKGNIIKDLSTTVGEFKNKEYGYKFKEVTEI